MAANKNLDKELRAFAKDLGISLFGVADIRKIKKEFSISSAALKGIDKAISLGARASHTVLDDIASHPTQLYFRHYRTINTFLDIAALRISDFLQDRGFLAIPTPASQVLDWKHQTGHLSHKQVGYLAGLGWIGRNNLLVNKKFGSQFRLVTILTNAPLEASRPTKENCAACFACVKACPAAAIKQKREDFDHIACFEKLKDFHRKRLAEQYICGICVKACRGHSFSLTS